MPKKGFIMTRRLFGKDYPTSPRPRRAFVSETKRWKYVMELLKDTCQVLPRSERQFYATMVEAWAYAEHRMEMEKGVVEEGKLGWSGDPELPFRGLTSNGGTTEPSDSQNARHPGKG